MPTAFRPHSCRYCKRIAVIRDRSGNVLQIDLSYREVLRAANLGCRLLQGRIHKLRSHYRRGCQSLRLRGHVMRDDQDSGFLWFHWAGFQSRDYLDELQVFALPGNPAGRHIANRPLNLDLASMQTFIARTKQYLNHCQEHHNECRKIWELRRSSDMPCRLIEVGSMGTAVVYLRVTKREEMERYAVPSYAWGTGEEAHTIHAIQTKRKNLQERMENGMQFSRLPRTIQDLVTVTRLLGLQYLWIDALCIVQDEPDEFRQEFERFKGIYERSEILISAAMAKHSDQGFLQARDPNQIYGAIYELPYQINLGGEEQGSIFLCEGSLFNEEEPVHKRIWTYQEHKLALRTLSIGSKQTRWECVESVAIDGGSQSQENTPSYLRRGTLKASLTFSDLEDYERDEMFIGWMTELEEYSARDSSRQADRLRAFAVSADLFASAIGLPISEYYEGLWKADTHRQLLWVKSEPQNQEERYAPSWSWASLPGPVTYPCKLDWHDCTLENIIFTREADQNICLEAKGYFREARWNGRSVRQLREEVLCMFPRGILPLKIIWDVRVPAQSIWLLEVTSKYLISKSRGLILVRNNGGKKTFKRCGYFELDRLWFINLDSNPLIRRRLVKYAPNWIHQGRHGYISIE